MQILTSGLVLTRAFLNQFLILLLDFYQSQTSNDQLCYHLFHRLYRRNHLLGERSGNMLARQL